MSIISAIASYEATSSFFPAWIYIDTTDDLATVMGIGYLNGQALQPCGFLGVNPVPIQNQMAMVVTTDHNSVILRVDIDGTDINLVAPYMVP